MPSCGVVVEGRSDRAVLKELIRKCSKGTKPLIRPVHGSVEGKIRGYLMEFKAEQVQKAIVLRDADRADPAGLERKILGCNVSFPVKVVIAMHKMEAWLLADEEALTRLSRKAKKKFANPENLSDPKKELADHLRSSANIEYTVEVARKIAGLVRVKVLRERCKSFQRFYEAVTDP